MTTQDIFKKFGSNWKWASISKHGNARVYTGEPVALASGLIQSPFGERVSRCEAFDNSANTEALIWKRTDFSNGPSYETDRFGIPLTAAAPQFQQPAALPARGYCTNEDCFNEKAIGWNQCETHRPPLAPAPGAVTLTTDEAENGGLWAFANHDENYVHVNSFGVVWFDLFKDGPKPRRSYGVEVSGVVNPIERTRSPQVSPVEAGMPYIDVFDTQPVAPQRQHEYVARCPGTSAEVCKSHACGCEPVDYSGDTPDSTYSVEQFATLGAKIQEVENELAKAKRNAMHLLVCYVQEGNCSRQALNALQYMAIFGEQPE